MGPISIRRATKSDAKPLAYMLAKSQWFTYEKLYSEKYIQNLIAQYYNLERIEDEIVSISRDWHGYFIAEINGSVVGAIAGGMITETAGEVYVFYLDPDMRGLGIGTRLLNFFTKFQKYTYGAQEQWVSVAKGNNFAIPYYESRGFIFQREEPTYGSTENDHDRSLKYKRDIE